MVLVLSSSPFRASPSSVATRQPAVRWFWKFCLLEILHFDLLSTPPRSSSLSLLLFPLAPSASRSSVFCVSLLPRPPLSRSVLWVSLLPRPSPGQSSEDFQVKNRPSKSRFQRTDLPGQDFKGPTEIRTRDLPICSRPPYRLATDPCNDKLRFCHHTNPCQLRRPPLTYLEAPSGAQRRPWRLRPQLTRL